VKLQGKPLMLKKKAGGGDVTTQRISPKKLV
jgi:hypothetical protein